MLGVALLVLHAMQAPASVAAPDATETYSAVSVDKNGHLAVRKADGAIVAVFRRPGQTTFEDPRLSPDRTAVGAQALYPNCCTSYDIPLGLVVYENGRAHWFRGIDLPIFRWAFLDGGRRIAFAQETVHSSCGTHYELRDVRSERLIESVNVPGRRSRLPATRTASQTAARTRMGETYRTGALSNWFRNQLAHDLCHESLPSVKIHDPKPSGRW